MGFSGGALLESTDRLHCKLMNVSFTKTGGHNWFPFTSKAKQLDDNTIQVLRHGAWVTSAGFADFYIVECTSPAFNGDFMNLSQYLMFKVRGTLQLDGTLQLNY